MKLHLLEQGIDSFLQLALQDRTEPWVYPHSLVAQFHRHWGTPDPVSLADRYQECLQSRHAQRWWKRPQYRPKELMEMLMGADPELAALAWKDLANESVTLEGRVDRFAYYCQDILDTLRRRDIRVRDTHHHQDAAIISLYLAGMYPDRYVLYPGLEAFRRFCQFVESPSIPPVDDLPRYMKIAAIVFKYLGANARWDALGSARATSRHAADFVPMQVAFEAITFLGGRPLSDY